MKYTYTDITTIETNMSLSLGDIESIIEYFSGIESSNKNWTITKFEKLLIQARKDTYNLMKIHAESNKEDENV